MRIGCIGNGTQLEPGVCGVVHAFGLARLAQIHVWALLALESKAREVGGAAAAAERADVTKRRPVQHRGVSGHHGDRLVDA